MNVTEVSMRHRVDPGLDRRHGICLERVYKLSSLTHSRFGVKLFEKYWNMSCLHNNIESVAHLMRWVIE